MGTPAPASKEVGVVEQRTMAGNMAEAVAMADHFEKIQKLKDPVPGCPNFRRVPGYKVYCCGQPTIAGFEAALTKVCGDIYPKDGKIIWINMRQEPSVYVNGEPLCARPANKIGEYAELGDITAAMIAEDEAEFAKMCENRAAENGGKLKYVDINKVEKEIEAKDVKPLTAVYDAAKEKFPGLFTLSLPVYNSGAPLDKDFDAVVQAMVGSAINCPVIVNDQVGLSRATTGAVMACLFKEFQINASFQGLTQTVPGVSDQVLRMDRYTMDPAKDALFAGNFEVVKKLVAELPGGQAAKNECDKVIDKNGTPKTGGTGIKQLRENIAESKLSYEIMDDAAQAFLKTKIMDNITKYYYLILFTAYMRKAADLARNACDEAIKAQVTLTSGKCSIPADQLKVTQSFVQFMEANSGMRNLIDTGKGDLQWERDIPPAALANLEELAKKDFKGNLGKIIHDIYQTAHTMFGDMPQGDHKKRAKYRFASKTLMRLLPKDMCGQVESMIEQKTITLDLYDILGQCTWGQK